MQRSIFNTRAGQLLFIFISLILLTALKAPAQIVLSDEPLPFKPKEFYIAGVTDERADKSAIAKLIVKTGANKTAIKTMGLQDGTPVAVKRFIDRNLQKDQSLQPVMVSIKEFRLTETPVTGGGVDGQIKLHLSFALQKDYGPDHLVDYQGGLHYVRHGDIAVERYLRNILKNGLVYFNNWIKINEDFSRKLAKDVKISFTDYTAQSEGDTIYYSPNRPLTWADFQSRIKSAGKFDAIVMPGIGYDQQAEVVKGTIYVNIAMKTYLPKSTCWVNYSSMNSYVLNHEQRHFDIVKIITEQFKQKILSQKLTPDTYEGLINMQYLDSYRNMDAMQKAYDKETSHGINRAVQDAWNNRIDKELKPGK